MKRYSERRIRLMKKNRLFLLFSIAYVIIAIVIMAALIGNKIPIDTLYERTFFVFIVFEILLLGSVANYAAYLTAICCNKRTNSSNNRKNSTLVFRVIYTFLHLLFWGFCIYIQVISFLMN